MKSSFRRRLLRPVWLTLAVVFLVEAWLWDHLGRLVGRITDLCGLPALRARLAPRLAQLPPAAALAVFLVPVVLVLPLKLLGLWLLARGSWLGAVVVVILAKLLSVGVTAFLFQATRSKLLQLAWFRWLHALVLAGLAWARRQTEPLRRQIRAWRRAISARSGRLGRRIVRLRRRAAGRV
jgi:hypothetical protein